MRDLIVKYKRYDTKEYASMNPIQVMEKTDLPVYLNKSKQKEEKEEKEEKEKEEREERKKMLTAQFQCTDPDSFNLSP